MFVVFRFAPFLLVAIALIITNPELQAFAKSLSLLLLALLLWPFPRVREMFSRSKT